MRTFNRSTSPRGRNKDGFTLIELLTVIAIIGILASILIPTVGRVRDSARTTQTLSNLRQIGNGIQMYALENRGEFPNEMDAGGTRRMVLTSRTVPGIGGQTNWREAIHRYTVSSGGYRPGSGYNFQIGALSDLWYTQNAERLGNHFGVNPFIGQSWWNYNLENIPSPSTTILLGEINHNGHVVDPRVQPDFTGNVISQYRISHRNGALYLFADGHVELRQGALHPDEFRHLWRFD